VPPNADNEQMIVSIVLGIFCLVPGETSTGVCSWNNSSFTFLSF